MHIGSWAAGLTALLTLGCAPRPAVGLEAMGRDPQEVLPPLEPGEAYRFLVAGHVYGRHDAPARGLFAPLRRAWIEAGGARDARFAVLCGDCVANPHPDRFADLQADLEVLGLPVFLAPGNHDTLKKGQPDVVTLLFGARRKAFRWGPDAFCVADTAGEGGNLGGEDLEAVRSLLAGGPRALFVFVHHLVWIDEAKVERGEVDPRAVNGLVGYAREGNWDREVLPLLAASRAPVLFFAGDLGAGSAAIAVHREPVPGVHLFATGMGEHPEVGSWLDVRVESGGIRVDVRGLGPTPDLGSYWIPF